MVEKYFRQIFGRLTGAKAMQARFDILQTKLDAQIGATAALVSAIERISAAERDDFQRNFDTLQNSLLASTQRLEAAITSLENINRVVMSLPSAEQLEKMGTRMSAENQQDDLLTKIALPTPSIRTISNLLNQICSAQEGSKRFAFLVHDPIMLVHYADVWKAIGSAGFAIVLTEHFASDANGNAKRGLADFTNHILKEGYEVRNIAEIINCGIKYEYVITNHVISGSTADVKPENEEDGFKKLLNRCLAMKNQDPLWKFAVDVDTYLPLQVGKKQIRYMYGADISDGWSLSNWNDIYDIFLCHGVNDKREISKRFNGEALIMGYPRYDRYFSENIDLSNIKREFGISESKRTLLWMPTLGDDYSSIPLFAEALSSLSGKFNLIVRPHPFSFVQEKEYIALLEKFNYNIDRTSLRDMNELFGIADVVLTDNGGTPFSAIFLGKNVIFLDVPDELDSKSAANTYISGSSVLELKKHLPVVKPQEMDLLENMLNSENFYLENAKLIEMLYRMYFDSPRGGGAKRAADIIMSL